MDPVFKALADPSRRRVLDALHRQDGLSLQALCDLVSFSRQGLSQHIDVLQQAGLVITEFEGRTKRHYLNPVPVHEITERWISKYARRQLDAIANLKQALEGDESMDSASFAYETYIRASRAQVWAGLTRPEFTAQYFYGTYVESNWKSGDSIVYRDQPGGTIVAEGEVLEIADNESLSFTWRFVNDPKLSKESPSRVTVRLTTSGDMTRLRIVHDQFPDQSATFGEISKGWPWVLSGLKSILETGEALPPLQSA